MPRQTIATPDISEQHTDQGCDCASRVAPFRSTVFGWDCWCGGQKGDKIRCSCRSPIESVAVRGGNKGSAKPLYGSSILPRASMHCLEWSATRGPSLTLRISAGGSDAAKTPQVRFSPAPLCIASYLAEFSARFKTRTRQHRPYLSGGESFGGIAQCQRPPPEKKSARDLYRCSPVAPDVYREDSSWSPPLPP